MDSSLKNIEKKDIVQEVKLKEGDSWFIQLLVSSNIQLDEKEFKKLWNLHPEERHTIKIGQKEIKVPRYAQSYGRSYAYSGTVNKALPIENAFLLSVQKYCQKFGEKCDQMMVSWYENGAHYIGPHSDDTKQFEKETSPIFSFSFGAERKFVVKSKKGDEKYQIKLKDNTCIIMGGEMQKYYTHEVSKQSVNVIKNGRINITLRSFK